MTKYLTLNWTDSKMISDLNYQDRYESGVYIWGFTINEVFIPYYVGIANNIIYRIYEHLSYIISGRYTIFHRESLAHFYQYNDKDVLPGKSEGKVYNPNWPKSLGDFLEKRIELQPHIDAMVESFTYSYAVVDKEQVSKHDLKEIEKICINQIGKEYLANSRAGHSDKFLIQHIGNTAITERMKAANP